MLNQTEALYVPQRGTMAQAQAQSLSDAQAQALAGVGEASASAVAHADGAGNEYGDVQASATANTHTNSRQFVRLPIVDGSAHANANVNGGVCRDLTANVQASALANAQSQVNRCGVHGDGTVDGNASANVNVKTYPVVLNDNCVVRPTLAIREPVVRPVCLKTFDAQAHAAAHVVVGGNAGAQASASAHIRTSPVVLDDGCVVVRPTVCVKRVDVNAHNAQAQAHAGLGLIAHADTAANVGAHVHPLGVGANVKAHAHVGVGVDADAAANVHAHINPIGVGGGVYADSHSRVNAGIGLDADADAAASIGAYVHPHNQPNVVDDDCACTPTVVTKHCHVHGSGGLLPIAVAGSAGVKVGHLLGGSAAMGLSL